MKDVTEVSRNPGHKSGSHSPLDGLAQIAIRLDYLEIIRVARESPLPCTLRFARANGLVLPSSLCVPLQR